MTDDKELAGKIPRKKGYMYWVDSDGNVYGKPAGRASSKKKVVEETKTETGEVEEVEEEEEDDNILKENNANEVVKNIKQVTVPKVAVPQKREPVEEKNIFQPAVNQTVKRRDDELKPKEKVLNFLKAQNPKDYWEVSEMAEAIKETKTEVVYGLQLLQEEFLVLDYDASRQYWKFNFEGLNRTVVKQKGKKDGI